MAVFGEQSTGPKVNEAENYGKANNIMRKVPLSPYEQREIDRGIKEPFFIYNVSPIHEWPRNQGEYKVVIAKAPWKFDGPYVGRISAPIIIPGSVCRMYDSGDRKLKPFIEGGLEVVEDIVGCSEKYPPQDPNANLKRFGVFFCTDYFGKLKAKEQEELFEPAIASFESVCRKLVQQAVQYHAGDPKQRAFIMPIHLQAKKVLDEIDGEEVRYEWAPTSSKKFKTCQFCGARNTPESVICVTCKEITDKAGYDKLKAGK